LGFRALLVAFLGGLMLIPLFVVENIIQERHDYHAGVLKDLASTWGSPQTLTGPILVVPYVEHSTSVDTVIDPNGESRVVSKDLYNERTAILLPHDLEIRADLKEEHRQQGIYDALVYKANLSLSGYFDHSRLIPTDKEGERNIQWDKAFITLGITDPKAIESVSEFGWDKERVKLEPGTGLPSLLATGLHAPLPNTDTNTTNHAFKLTLTLRGSEGLSFAPMGETTKARMTSTGIHPGFEGSLLPSKQESSAQGFKAEWEIPHLARNFPQYWELEDKPNYNLQQITAGVSLSEPVMLYSRILHSSQYGALFIGLTFLIFFAFEMGGSGRKPLHVLQYVLVGAALSLFYLLLMALAEQFPFLDAYLAAAGTTVLSISLYTWAMLRSKGYAFVMLMLLTVLYGALYFLQEMEGYALLFGTGLLVLATTAMMYLTLHLRRPA
jgi:inner membrane protein